MSNISKGISLGTGATNDSLDNDIRTQHVSLYDKNGNAIESIDNALTTVPYSLAVARGLITGISLINKFGENPDIDSSAEDIWDLGGAYVFSTTAAIDSMSSSNNGDTIDITIEGLDENWLEVSQTLTSTGQTRVAFTTPLIRINRAYNADSTTVAGIMYFYENTAIVSGVPTDTSKIRSLIRDGNNQTLQAIYSVPANKTGYLINVYYTISRDKANITADVSWRKQEFGKKFRVQQRASLMSTGSSNWDYTYKIPVLIPPKSDIKVRCESVSTADVAIGAGFTMYLVDT